MYRIMKTTKIQIQIINGPEKPKLQSELKPKVADSGDVYVFYLFKKCKLNQVIVFIPKFFIVKGIYFAKNISRFF